MVILNVFKPKIDPCIFLHRDAEDWTRLLGEDFIDELIRRFSHVVRDVDELVEYVFEYPEAFHIGLRGLRVGGPYKEQWLLYIESGYVDPGWRAKWPYVPSDGELDVRLQVSPCYLLTVLNGRERAYIWRNRAPAIFKWISAVPRRRPLDVFREAFPAWIRELAWTRGYSWVAWSRWRDRRNKHLAEWLYWLDSGRMAHIDMAVGRFRDVYETAARTIKSGAEVLYELS
ncbi:hypothetical protein [Pyrobaculum aerophilum]|uniref:hypothetical protein n=1 Tax=Pyrobaculum aerophilum TaxID=13773 RepID=UPI002FDB4091